MQKQHKILIVEDEWKLARFIQMELEHEGFITEIEGNGRMALDKIIQGNNNLILLDIMIPELDGIEICKRVREVSDIPIIMLTARDEISDKVKGLNLGANDYMTKPFAMQELLARIDVALRNYLPRQTDVAHTHILQCNNLHLFPHKHEVYYKNQLLELTKKEYDLLEYLLRNQGLVRSRDQILQDVWGVDYFGDTNIVDVYIRYIRSKLDEQYQEKYIHTIRGVCYVLKN